MPPCPPSVHRVSTECPPPPRGKGLRIQKQSWKKWALSHKCQGLNGTFCGMRGRRRRPINLLKRSNAAQHFLPHAHTCILRGVSGAAPQHLHNFTLHPPPHTSIMSLLKALCLFAFVASCSAAACTWRPVPVLFMNLLSNCPPERSVLPAAACSSPAVAKKKVGWHCFSCQ